MGTNDDAQGPVDVTGGGRPLERRPQVVEVGADDGHPAGLVRTPDRPCGLLDHPGEVVGMVVSRHFGPTGGGEPLRAVLAEGRQHGVAAPLRGTDHRLVDQLVDVVEHVQLVGVHATTHAGGGVDGEPTGEHRQRLEEPLAALVEQVVGPVDGRPQGAMTFGVRSTTRRQETEPLVETLGDLGRGHRP